MASCFSTYIESSIEQRQISLLRREYIIGINVESIVATCNIIGSMYYSPPHLNHI